MFRYCHRVREPFRKAHPLKVPILALTLLALNSCVYGNVVYPLDKDVAETRLGSRQGQASAQSVAWLVAWGDAGVEAAARNGSIQVIRHLDVERTIIFFGLYAKITTIAYGD